MGQKAKEFKVLNTFFLINKLCEYKHDTRQ